MTSEFVYIKLTFNTVIDKRIKQQCTRLKLSPYVEAKSGQYELKL